MIDIVNQIKGKEYQILSLNKYEPIRLNENTLDNQTGLIYHTGQRFVKNWINVHKHNTRLLIKHDTGTGKTISALAIAMDHINYLKDNNIEDKHIYIIGFSADIFKSGELLRRPEFGFVKQYELDELERLKYLASIGTEQDKNTYREMKARLNKRLSNKNWGGYFKFIGYKEFYNRLFSIEDAELDIKDMFEAIQNNDVELNWNLIEKMSNCLLICDEIHNSYNSLEINNYGLAIKFVLDLYDIPQLIGKKIDIPKKMHSVLRKHFIKIVYMSATPLNNKPTEIIDLLNLLVPASEIHKIMGKYIVDKSDFFIDEKLKNMDQMRELLFGYVSFLSGKDPEIYPEKKYLGEKIPGIKYIRFERCIMPKKQFVGYKEVLEKSASNSIDIIQQMVNDIIIPIDGKSYTNMQDLKGVLQQMPEKKREKLGIYFTSNPFSINGPIMYKDNIKEISGKYYHMLNLIDENLKNDGGKIFISHQRVSSSGINQIEQILMENGIINEYASPHENTKCSICGVLQKKHKKDDHNFIPTRYVVMTGEIPKKVIEETRQKYNNMDNAMGHKYKILLGSKKINEGVDFNCIQHLWIMSLPKDISTMFQIIGRGARNKSHIMLPIDMRKVNIRVFVSSHPNYNGLSYEERKYKEKMEDYLIIQEIEKIMNSEAVDSHIHRNIIEPTMEESLGAIPFKPTNKIKDGLEMLNYDFYIDDEIRMIMYIIKRLLLEQSDMYTIEDLYEHVKHPPFKIPMNTAMFEYDNFLLAVDQLLWKDNITMQEYESMRLNDPNQILIPYNGNLYGIIHIKDYIMILPMINYNTEDIVEIDERKKYTDIGTDIINITGIPQNYLGIKKYSKNKFNITNSLENINISFTKMKLKFFEQFRKIPIHAMPITTEIYNIDFHKSMIQDCISYVFHLMTNPDMYFSELHEFYFKMIFFYDRQNMIIFADHLLEYPQIYSIYENYIDQKEVPDEHNNRFFISSIEKLETNYSTSTFHMDKMNRYLRGFRNKKVNDKSEWATGLKVKTSEKYMALKIPNYKKIHKAPATQLPIGHFIDNKLIPSIYDPENQEWRQVYEIQKNIDPTEIENDIIIGYYEKSISDIQLVFKLRPPRNKKKFMKDRRKEEKGSRCINKNKKYIVDLCKKLNIKGISEDDNNQSICDQIKLKLIKLEMDERRQKNKDPNHQKVRWFYMHYEKY